MQFIKFLVAFCLIGTGIGAPSNLIFDQSEANPTTTEALKFEAETETTVPTFDQSAPSPAFFPSSETETESESVGELKAPAGIVPAPVAGTEQTDGRTFHHLAKLHYKVDQTLQHFWHKLVSPWFYHGEPHHFPQGPYFEYDSHGDYRKDSDIYRKDSLTSPTSTMSRILTPLVKAPQYFVNHPINFKQGLANLQHAIGKRSVESTRQGSENFESPLQGSENFETSRQGKTLDKIIPGFEERMGILMRRVFGDLYGSNQNNFKSDFPATSKNPTLQLPQLKFTQMASRIANYVGHQLNKLRNPEHHQG